MEETESVKTLLMFPFIKESVFSILLSSSETFLVAILAIFLRRSMKSTNFSLSFLGMVPHLLAASSGRHRSPYLSLSEAGEGVELDKLQDDAAG